MCTIATHACYVVTLVFKSGRRGAKTMRIAATIIIIRLVSCKGSSDYIPPPVAKAPPSTVAFMGDSITALWDLADYDSSPTLNFGISGDNTEQMLARFHNQVIDSDPAVVVILGGINDFQEPGGIWHQHGCNQSDGVCCLDRRHQSDLVFSTAYRLSKSEPQSSRDRGV